MDIPLMQMVLGMATTNIYYVLVTIAFSVNGISDMKNQRVYSLPVVLTFISGIFLSPYPVVCILGLVVSIICTDDRFHFPWIGAGDIDAIILMISALGMVTIPYLTIASIASLIWGYALHEKMIPYVYFIGISYLIFCIRYLF